MSSFMANKTVLLPYDFSDASNAAIDEAFGMIDDTTKVFVLHVLMPNTNVSLEAGIMTTDLSNAQEEARRVTAMKAMKERIQDPLDRTFLNVRFVIRVRKSFTSLTKSMPTSSSCRLTVGPALPGCYWDRWPSESFVYRNVQSWSCDIRSRKT